MNTAALLVELSRQGIELRPDGGTIRYRAPRGTVTAELRETISAHKPELLELLKAAQIAPDEGQILEARSDLAAVRISSPEFGEVWLARDDRVAAELNAEGADLPVLTFAEIPKLRGKSPEMLRAVLECRRAFPGGSILQ